MNKVLYVRFWENKKQGLPNDSKPVSYWGSNKSLMNIIKDWMAAYPDGKVEFLFME